MEIDRVKTFSDVVDIGTSTAEALAIFDGLDTVDIDFMFGSWKGTGFPTDHPLDGLLEAYHWHGKRFDNPEQVHPLVFRTMSDQTISVNPLWIVPIAGSLDRLPIPKSKVVGRIFQLCIGLFATHRPCARLRMTTYRSKESATMIYDGLPINDIFRKINENTVLGVMDLKGMEQPFFFVLQRE
ncbi:MAG: DUF4334 domain-containing protein [Leptolyngbyaceae cyanobacterium CAN_BIN12]|nr:DUF4334 domain-containing protein [Leptolyngbyaceae cyanobacterium CAN_BIN12]